MDQGARSSRLVDTAYVGEFDVRKAIMEHLERSRGGDRTARDQNTLVNLRWYRNQPYWRVNHLGRLQQIKPDMRGRYVPTNLMFESIRTVSSALQFPPKVEPFVKQHDRGDYARARMMSAIGNHVIQSGQMHSAMAHSQDIVQLGGFCALKPVWDPSRGEIRPGLSSIPCPQCGGSGVQDGEIGPEACPRCSAQGLVRDPNGGLRGAGEVNVETRGKPVGNVMWEVVPPWELFPDADAPSIHMAEAMLQRTKMTPARFWKEYGKSAGLEKSAFMPESGGDLDLGGAILRSGPAGFGRSDENSFYVYEWWKNPDDEHPDGLWCVMAGEQVVLAQKYPPACGVRHPFFILTCYETWGSLYPTATADIILPLCQVINDHISAQHVRDRLASKLRFIAPREAQLRVDEATGQVQYTHVPGRPAPAPAMMPPSDSGMGLVNFLWGVVKSHAAANDVMRGEGGGDLSGVAAAWMEDRALRQLSGLIAQQTTVIEAAIRYAIDLFWANAEDGRRMRLVGSGGAYEVHSFDASAVGESDDVRLVMTKDIGRTRTARMQELNEMAKMQMIDAKTYQRLAEIGETAGYNTRARLNANAANMEYQELVETGQMPPAIDGEDDEAHLEQHDLQIIELKGSDPNSPLIPVIQQHREMHKQNQANQAFRDQMRMAQAQQQFGAVNGADAAAQPVQTQQAAADVFPQGGPPGSQPSLEAAQQSRTDVQGGGEQ